jgi:hypothetical protein
LPTPKRSVCIVFFCTPVKTGRVPATPAFRQEARKRHETMTNDDIQANDVGWIVRGQVHCPPNYPILPASLVS